MARPRSAPRISLAVGSWRASAVLVLVGLIVLAGLVVSPIGRAAPTTSGVGLSLTASPTSGTAPLSVAFVATLTPSTITASFNWSFGDGEYYNLTATGGSDPVHTYAAIGSYDAKVAIGSTSGDANASLTVTVVAENLVATIGATPTSGPAPLTVHFVATFSGGTGTYESILWNFGDGDSGSGPVLDYTYPVAGTFQVNLTVTDSSGRSVRDQQTIVVGPPGGNAQTSSPPSALAVAVPYLLALAVLLAIAAVAALSYRSVARRRAAQVEAPPGALAEPPSSPEVPSSSELTAATGATEWASTTGAAVNAGPSAALDDSRRLSERILIHLFWYGRPGPDGIARAEATQQGMARALNTGQNTISKALSRLRDAGAVKVELQHVPGAPRRVKTYSLTPRGEAVARSLTRNPGAGRSVGPP